MVVITIELGNLAFLDLINEGFSTFIVDFIVLELKLLKGGALFHKLGDHLST